MAGLTNQPYMAYSTRDTPLDEPHLEPRVYSGLVGKAVSSQR